MGAAVVDVSLGAVEWPTTPFPLLDRALVVGRRGSEAHGTYVPPDDPNSIDDRDLHVVFVQLPRFYLGASAGLKDHYEDIKGCWDVCADELRKFVGMAAGQNPNVLSLFWLDDGDYLLSTPLGTELVKHRHLFRAKHRAFMAYTGYAKGQLQAMTSGAFKGYMGEKRKQLVEKYGYDTKNASHLLRLLRMSIEYLRTGEMQVKRTDDAEFFIDVKRGRYTLEEVQGMAEELFAQARDAYQHSPLPDDVDLDAINQLTTRLVLQSITQVALR